MIVPEGWRAPALGDLLVVQPNGKLVQQGWSPQCLASPAPAHAWGVLKTTAIQAGWFDDSQHKELPDGLAPRPGIEVKVGDLLITCAGPRARCGVPTLVRSTRPRLMMSGKMYRFRPDPQLDAKYLELWLLSPEAQRRIDRMKTGISDSGLNLTHSRFLQLPVPHPELREQHRIVALLEEHLSDLEAAIGSLESAERRTARLVDSTLDRSIWSGNAPTRSLSEVLGEPMRNGRSDRAVAAGEEGVRCLTLTAVTKRQFTDGNTKFTGTPIAAARELWLMPGDILVERSNTPELVGTAARYDGPEHWAIFPDLMIRVRVNPGRADSAYVEAALRSERAHRWLRSRAKGLSGSMPKIDQGTLGALRLPFPDLDDQRRTVGELELLGAAVTSANAAVEKGRRRAVALRHAVLVTAFSGRLTGHESDTDVISELAEEESA